jgi:hypothetical protein
MARWWKDKSGLKMGVSEPTVVDQKIDEMNRLAASINEMKRKHGEEAKFQMSGNRWDARNAEYQMAKEIIDAQGAHPRQENGVWSVPIDNESRDIHMVIREMLDCAWTNIRERN